MLHSQLNSEFYHTGTESVICRAPLITEQLGCLS